MNDIIHRERDLGEGNPGEGSIQASIVPLVSDGVPVFVRASKADSAASIPVFMALCEPLTFGTFMKPGLQPIKAPPGNANLGML